MRTLICVHLLFFVLGCTGSKEHLPPGIIGKWHLVDLVSEKDALEEIMLLYALLDNHLAYVEVTENELRYLDGQGRVIQSTTFSLNDGKMKLTSEKNAELKVNFTGGEKLVLEGGGIIIKLRSIKE